MSTANRDTATTHRPRHPPACPHGGAFFDVVGAAFESLDRRRRVIDADVLDAWFDPSPRVLESLRDLAWVLRTSPPADCGGLVREIARARGVDPACVLAGAGSSDLIYRAFGHWFTRDSKALILDPTYGEYPHILENVIRCRVERLTLDGDEDYDLDPRRLRGELEKSYDLVVLVNPNSPTGRHVPRQALEEVLAVAPSTTRIWLDETYVDYAGSGESLERFASLSRNVVVCKSMSKVYALSGARVAYLCGPERSIAGLRPTVPPWAVSLPGQIAAVMALRDPEYYVEHYRQTHRLRDDLARELRDRCGLVVVPSVANFLLCRLPEESPGARVVVEACRERDLLLRDAGGMGRSLGDRFCRIAVKDRSTNERIVEVLAEVLGEVLEAGPGGGGRRP